MASGFGSKGQGRCYPSFATFEKCMNEAEVSSVCYPLREEYFKCLHVVTNALLDQKRRNEELQEKRKSLHFWEDGED
ncbi:unnamed protein product [Choristocarpus tenellus]